jgi:hypothetical protein
MEGHPCDTGDNQRSSGAVIMKFRLFGALVHQRRVLHQSSLPYLSEDRDSSSYECRKEEESSSWTLECSATEV